MSQDKWKKIDPSNASDWTNPVITQDPMDYDPAHPDLWNKWVFLF